MAAFRLTSPAFDDAGPIPDAHTGWGEDRSPPLQWEGVPEGTQELVLVCEDPDADEGVLTHWLAYGIPPDVDGLPEGLPRSAVIQEPVEVVQGLNEFGEVGYVGPQREEAEDRGPHRYFFRLHALDVELLDVPPGVTREELRASAKGHVIESTEFVGIA
ncbi:YbhB/YbcL family Raf kinase inhibitor-like protein [Egibacter rhizosphaerae]|uniref:YbhB/YbcL family Raf kinase inhibitor-like protein n=1 Tax=Egibacter rhizosphaerae TaxID=1670831 RepID=A0A411YAQ0_9ACTN|nr:YbhB/YbcL family Raf kinase inhibitor-like protein [Egibacter rhizosphaerae]QBI18257.1 YbhB/YbcL family Raf kinase inhibitor-like protein [Egibacter rhizosphaerae]